MESLSSIQQAVYQPRFKGTPSVVTDWNGIGLAVFFRGLDNRLRWKVYHTRRWHGDAIIEGGGELTSDPVAVPFGENQLGVFYRGSGDYMIWRAFDSGRWHGEERFDAQHSYPTQIASAPSVVSGWANHQFAVFFRGIDGRLRWKAHHGGRWHGDAPVEGGDILTSSPAVIAYVET